MPSPLATYGLAALLLASLAVNVRLWTTRGAVPAGSPRPPASASAPPPADPASCERRLEACHKQSWQIAQRVITADHPPRPSSPSPSVPHGSDRAAQESALCTRAKTSLKETWQRDRDAIAF